MNLRTRALLASPLLLALYGAVRLIPGSRQPGPGWTAGHTALLAAMVLLGVGFVELYRRIRPRTAPGRVAAALSLAVAMLGLAASLGQVSIDLYVGAVAADKADQHAMFDRIQAHPGVMPAFYSVGPLLFYVGLLALVCGLAAVRRLPWWSPVLVLAATVLMGASLDLLSVGALLYLAAFLPLTRPARSAGPVRAV
ncbi:hypothetical protein [Kitasatospora cinereorecta]|uniref:DUF4386 domain-containing protein n=1 Tax=Kitasatospora cinereorecta TaxID=285560 RepID=A0ABW0V3X9_9ACTN